MYSQFTREFVKVIYLFCDDNVIVIRKERRAKESFKIFVKYTSSWSLAVILKKINLFSNHLKSLFESLVNYRYYLFSLHILERLFYLIKNNLIWYN